EGLTIGAMTDSDLGRVDFGLEADLTTMAASGDFHRHFSLDGPARCWAWVTAKITRLSASGNGGQPSRSPDPSKSFRSSIRFSIGCVVVCFTDARDGLQRELRATHLAGRAAFAMPGDAYPTSWPGRKAEGAVESARPQAPSVTAARRTTIAATARAYR